MDERENEFVASVVANPGDDGPRLAYADWLETAGRGARAELIRLQCDVAAKQHRVDELLTEHGREWAAPYDQRHVHVTAFRRGFPEEFRVDWPPQLFFDAAEFMQTTTPVTGLAFPQIDDVDLASVANSPVCRNLKKLHIEHGDFGAAGIRAVCKSANMKGLTELAIGSRDIGHAGVESLLKAPFIENLERLTLFGDPRLESGYLSKVIAALDHNTIRELNWLGTVYDRADLSLDRKTRPPPGVWTL